jgi:uncharacterized protein YjiS (DUF1127 family)
MVAALRQRDSASTLPCCGAKRDGPTVASSFVPARYRRKRNAEMLIAQLIEKIRVYLTYRRNRAILEQLSDRDLKDIGLDRSRIEYAARHAANA